MIDELVFTGAQVVTRDRIISGSVQVKNGLITDVGPGRTGIPGAIHLEGDYLIPGLVETHTDNFEKHLVPRPGVLWPSALAGLIAHDNQIAGAGITTVLDAVFLGNYMDSNMRQWLVKTTLGSLGRAREQGLFRADHQIHLRCEVADETVWELFQEYCGLELLRLVSLNDHTPNQRQWSDIRAFQQFHSDKNWTDEQLEEVISERLIIQNKYAADNRRLITAFCRSSKVSLASHDDTTKEHIWEAVGEGVTISEFPTTLEAAREARRSGLAVVAGAPNMVRGKSHSHNVAAKKLAAENLLDVLSSDYVPGSLLHAAFIAHQQLDYNLPAAIRLVSANPAKLIGLEDRGSLEPGKRADMIRVRLVEDLPVVRAVWRAGKRVN